jgi:hypothetical protein
MGYPFTGRFEPDPKENMRIARRFLMHCVDTYYARHEVAPDSAPLLLLLASPCIGDAIAGGLRHPLARVMTGRGTLGTSLYISNWHSDLYISNWHSDFIG